MYVHRLTPVQQIQLCSGFLSSPRGKGVNPLQRQRKRRRKRENKKGTDERFRKKKRKKMQGRGDESGLRDAWRGKTSIS